MAPHLFQCSKLSNSLYTADLHVFFGWVLWVFKNIHSAQWIYRLRAPI